MTWFDWVENLKARKQSEKSNVSFTPAANQALGLAYAEAKRLSHDFVGAEHLLLGVIKSSDGVCAEVLQKLGLEPQTVVLKVENSIGVCGSGLQYGNLPYTPRSKKVIEMANREAKSQNHSSVGPEHLLLALLAEGDGVAGRVLRSFDVSLGQMRKAVLEK